MLQFYSTANITKQMPDRYPPPQCTTKDKQTLGLQTVGVGYGLIAMLQGAKGKIGTFQRSVKVVRIPGYIF